MSGSRSPRQPKGPPKAPRTRTASSSLEILEAALEGPATEAQKAELESLIRDVQQTLEAHHHPKWTMPSAADPETVEASCSVIHHQMFIALGAASVENRAPLLRTIEEIGSILEWVHKHRPAEKTGRPPTGGGVLLAQFAVDIAHGERFTRVDYPVDGPIPVVVDVNRAIDLVVQISVELGFETSREAINQKIRRDPAPEPWLAKRRNAPRVVDRDFDKRAKEPGFFRNFSFDETPWGGVIVVYDPDDESMNP